MTDLDRNHERVLEHVAWVQRLAYRLCADAALAEDVSQESLLSAFREPRRRGPALRHWLVGVVRNQVRMARRDASRRHDREAQAQLPQDVASPTELVANAANHRVVVEAVTELPEIYRTALLRRYFDDLGPAQIAALEGVPEATIKTRLRRGLELLRRRLADNVEDRGQSGSSAWLAALLPMARIELRRLGAAAGATKVGLRLGWWLVAATAVGVCCWAAAEWWGPEPAAVDSAASPMEQEHRARGNDERMQLAGKREPDVAVAGGVPEVPAPVSLLAVTAQVCDTDGRPVSGLGLILRSFDQEEASRCVGRTDTYGVGTFEVEAELSELRARSSDWVTVVPGTIFPYAPSALVRVVVARRRSVCGVVTDPRGVSIAGARVTYSAGAQVAVLLDVPVDRASRRRWSTTSDALGAFALHVPELPGARLQAEAWDHESTVQQIASHGDLVETCVLAERGDGSSWLQGRVRLTSGQPATTAVVAVGAQAVRCGPEGRFRIDLAAERDSSVLQVVARGLAPETVLRPTDGWPAELELELSQPPQTIGGVVHDGEGRPRAGVEVDLVHPCGRAFLSDVEHDVLRAVPLEQLCLGGRTAAVTDERGRFVIGGLAARSYRLVLRDRSALAIEVSDAIPAGTSNLALDLETPADLVPVAGRLVDDVGQPLRGAPVTALVMLDREVSVHASCRTDAHGRFAFVRPIRRDALLRVAAGGNYTAVDLELSLQDAADALQLVVRRVGSFYLYRMGTDGPEVDGFRLESLDGDPVRLQRVEGRMCFTIDGSTIEAGRSPVVRAPVGGHQLVLLHRGREVRRRPVDVLAGPPVRIDF